MTAILCWSVREAAAWLHLTPAGVREAIWSHRLRAHKYRGRWVLTPWALDAFATARLRR